MTKIQDKKMMGNNTADEISERFPWLKCGLCADICECEWCGDVRSIELLKKLEKAEKALREIAAIARMYF